MDKGIGFLKKFWEHILDFPKDGGTEYDVTLSDEETTHKGTIVGHLRRLYEFIANAVSAITGGTSTESTLVKVTIEATTAKPSVDVAVTEKDDAKKTLTNTALASKEYVDAKKTTYDGLYLAKSSGANSALNLDSKGSVANFSTNGQAYLAVRPKEGAEFLPQIPQPYAGAAFGVKLDGTTAFSHKTYATYNSKTGAYTGARNTAILQFAGSVGLRYAKNTSTGNDVTEDMYKYVGVIDSDDEFQRVYSAKQVDDIIAPLVARIEALEEQIRNL